MWNNRRVMVRVAICCFAIVSAVDSSAQAQPEEEPRNFTDEEARGVFAAGTAAYADARFEDALRYFRQAHELSGRDALLYNIGLALDRLRRDSEALEAFEQFIEREPDHAHRPDAEAKIAVLREMISRQP